jgi:hypothetical protein
MLTLTSSLKPILFSYKPLMKSKPEFFRVTYNLSSPRTLRFSVNKQRNKKLHGLSPRTNYIDRATAACWWSQCQRLRIEGDGSLRLYSWPSTPDKERNSKKYTCNTFCAHKQFEDLIMAVYTFSFYEGKTCLRS